MPTCSKYPATPSIHVSAAPFALIYILMYQTAGNYLCGATAPELYSSPFIPGWFMGAAEHQAAFSSSGALHLRVWLHNWCPLCRCVPSPRAPASSDTAALQDQGGRITHLRGGTRGSTAQARTSVLRPQQNQHFLI